ncbi:MAG: tRNA (adenosine(37)-N6)-threonylcarbamoyltransferase complex ATPase subunit type 1 TsaE [Prevotellaceae bacterium]|jgi:tRNA threonylcarbamoyladenosine biosynthesis protein TsaE|nr:tRNA (adenosine(37)-N6)-threonylcarbamoyltransferase complex ATPase subunit type 1 TsaE [Prevotellaceae bacterium]
MQLNISSLEEINTVAREFIQLMSDRRVFAFYGAMGAGKTSFIKAICEEMGVTDPVSSPTFSIVNEYASSKGEQIYHFDFYRINSPEEAFDFGYEDYFYSGAYCFIEWAERIENLLPHDCLSVYIEIEADNSRKVIF